MISIQKFVCQNFSIDKKGHQKERLKERRSLTWERERERFFLASERECDHVRPFEERANALRISVSSEQNLIKLNIK